MSLSFNSRYAGKIHLVDALAQQRKAAGFNSRYAGKIHLFYGDDLTFADVSIPAMRVRYISKNNGKHYH